MLSVTAGGKNRPADDSMMVRRWNSRKIILALSGIDATEPEEEEPNAISKKLAQAHRLMKMIETDKYPTMTMLAEELRLDPSVVTKTINMVNLSPKLQKMIVESNTPEAINREKLFVAIP